MKNKILLVLVIILSALVIFQSIYLLNLENKQIIHLKKTGYYKHMPTHRIEADYYPVFERMRIKDPFNEMELMQRRIDRIFEESLAEPKNTLAMNASKRVVFFKPHMDVKQTEAAYILSIDLPGIEKSEINIQVKDGYLTVSGERKVEGQVEKEGVYQQEINIGSFFRAVVLPKDAMIKQITSEYTQGVLMVNIPRKIKPKTQRTPAIKVPVR